MVHDCNEMGKVLIFYGTFKSKSVLVESHLNIFFCLTLTTSLFLFVLEIGKVRESG